MIDRHGAWSAEVAAALATRCRKRFQSDYALAVGAFPPLDPDAKSPPRCYIALAAADGTTTKPIPFAAHPDMALVQRLDGYVVRSPTDVSVGDALRVRLAEGQLTAAVQPE